MEVHERRRLVVATAFTLIALPSIWLFDRNDPDSAGPSTVAAAGVATPDKSASGTTPTTEPEVPIFLDNTIVVVAPAVIDVALPDAPGDREKQGKATYKRYVDSVIFRPCTTYLAPSGATITVTNTDNGLSTTCTNTLGVSKPPDADIVMDTDVYVAIADLVDAPVPVRLDW
ncbi:MAG: hypothetical protein JWN99_1892 [Ilumatobacteraceae bacterium]|nr:hypothetical protein [Ilumatobacteraceae bacterium]